MFFLALYGNVVLKESNLQRILRKLPILNKADNLVRVTGYEAQRIVDFDKFHFLSFFLSRLLSFLPLYSADTVPKPENF